MVIDGIGAEAVADDREGGRCDGGMDEEAFHGAHIKRAAHEGAAPNHALDGQAAAASFDRSR